MGEQQQQPRQQQHLFNIDDDDDDEKDGDNYGWEYHHHSAESSPCTTLQQRPRLLSPPRSLFHLPDGARELLRTFAAQRILILTVQDYHRTYRRRRHRHDDDDDHDDGTHAIGSTITRRPTLPRQPLLAICQSFPHLLIRTSSSWWHCRGEDHDNCCCRDDDLEDHSDDNSDPDLEDSKSRTFFLTWILRLAASPPLELVRAVIRADPQALMKESSLSITKQPQRQHCPSPLHEAMSNPWVSIEVVAELLKQQLSLSSSFVSTGWQELWQTPHPVTGQLPLFELCRRPCPTTTNNGDGDNLRQEQEALYNVLQTIHQQPQPQPHKDDESSPTRSLLLLQPQDSNNTGWTLLHVLLGQGGWCGVPVVQWIIEIAQQQEQQQQQQQFGHQTNNILMARTVAQGWTPLHVLCQSTTAATSSFQSHDNDDNDLVVQTKAQVAAYLCRVTPMEVHYHHPSSGRSNQCSLLTPLEYAVQTQPLRVIQAMIESLGEWVVASNSKETVGDEKSETATIDTHRLRTSRLLHFAAQCNPRTEVIRYLCDMFPQCLSTPPNQLEQQQLHQHYNDCRNDNLRWKPSWRSWHGNNNNNHRKREARRVTLLRRMLPLHWACRSGASLSNIQVLVEAFPPALWWDSSSSSSTTWTTTPTTTASTSESTTSMGVPPISSAQHKPVPSNNSNKTRPTTTTTPLLEICRGRHGSALEREYLQQAMQEYDETQYGASSSSSPRPKF
mmetsp:Transcript_5179/g.10652  ORF Transcript_5179/g.10652 Transcript_5179/m.10652 type:complete len:727 (+) Transcript_5179:146-2326(+)